MSREILQRLLDERAFKPSPPDYELAIAHVRVNDVGIPHAIDDKVTHAITAEDEAFVIIVGPPGSGKSSILTAAALTVASPHAAPHPLPLMVPVAYHDDITVEVLVKAITQTLAYELRGHLTDDQARNLEKALAATISKSRQPGGLSGSISAGHPGLLSATVGAALGKDLVTRTTESAWHSGPPVSRLLALRDLAAGHEAQLVVIFHDSDIWSVADEEAAGRARGFFSALRVLLDCPEVTFIVAVQTQWTEPAGDGNDKRTIARKEFHELAERAGVSLVVAEPQSDSQALALITAIIDRRAEIVLDDVDIPEAGWAATLFTPAALSLLAHRCRRRSVRRAITDIRDAFERAEEMPDQIDREHLLEVLGD